MNGHDGRKRFVLKRQKVGRPANRPGPVELRKAPTLLFGYANTSLQLRRSSAQSEGLTPVRECPY